MTLAHSHNLGCLDDGKVGFQNAVEHLNPCLSLLMQRHIPHRNDVVAEQLAGDRIVDHQHLAVQIQAHYRGFSRRIRGEAQVAMGEEFTGGMLQWLCRRGFGTLLADMPGGY